MTSPIDQYFDNLKNPKQLDDLQRLRAFIQQTLPDAREDMTYNMPTYSQHEQVVVAMASQRNYMSLYLDVELVEKYRDQLGTADCGKSCVRFKKLDDLSLETVATILKETVEKQNPA